MKEELDLESWAGFHRPLDAFRKKNNLYDLNLFELFGQLLLLINSQHQMKPINMTHFARLCGLVKGVKRTGWTRYLKEPEVESVADHSCRIAMLTMAFKSV